MNINSIIVALIATFIFIFVINTFMGIFFDGYRRSTKVVVLSYLFYSILAMINLFILQNFSLSHPLLMGIAYFIISLNYDATMVKRVVAVICLYLLCFAIEIVIVASLILFFLTPLGISSEVLSGNFNLLIPIHVAFYLLCRWLKRFKNIKKDIHLPKFWFITLLTQIIIIVAIFTSMIWLPLTAFLNAVILLAFNLFILFLYNSISEAYEEKLKVALHSQEKQYYLSQSEMMNDSVEQMKAFKHDIRNHLVTLKEYTEKGNLAETLNYFDKLLGDVEANGIYSDTGNIPFDSIINYKFRHAEKDGIKLTLNLSLPQTLHIDTSDIVTILGNLLNNALEAVEKVTDKWIRLDIVFDKGCLFIQIDNSFDGVITYSEEKQYPATLKLVAEHGYGFKNISQSIDNYHGELQTSHTGNVFSAIVFLYVSDK